MNILFVERDPSRRLLVKDMLRNAGATLVERGQDDGLGCASALSIGLVMVEVTECDGGARLIARIKGLLRQSPPIIALVDHAELANASRDGGADMVLVEPVPMTVLFDAIGRCLPGGTAGGNSA